MHTALTRFRPALTVAAIAGLLLAAGAPVQAQTPSEADLEALRFYIEEDNEQAIRSEIRRLQLRYPDWTVPDDLTNLQRDVPSDTIDRIYDQIAAGDFDSARETIGQTTQSYPDWSPSAQLLQALTIAEAQARFTEAVEGSDPSTAVRIARSNPGLLRCERVNNAWLLAEQYQSLDENSAALEVYRSTIRSCTDADILVATLEKAAAVASVAQLAELSDAARQQAPGAAERLTAVQTRLRAGIEATGGAPDPGAASSGNGSASAPLTSIEVEEVPTATSPTTSLRPAARPAALSRPRTASPPARSSAPQGGSPGVLSQARQAADRADWSRCLALTANSSHGAVLSQRGWCALNANRTMEALTDFRAAAQRAPTAENRRDSAYGMALAMLRLNMVDEAAAVAARTHFTDAQRLEIEGQILDKRGVAAYERRDYRRAIAYFNELERVTGVVRRDLALLRGYAYLNSGQRTAARAEFQRLHNQMATPASRRALSEAMR
ncbi:hypothetical protein [Roseivivax sediminis]|uniref:Tetratricopeptide repeat-containing protein n=1 Tax=Roseivivax sediminis TaxID=936889 RepID=A0A1I1VUL6_9RHOB|nr:hypothetical protein [Roseivivax sediminis]SFD84250.1 Tetratricopeptide repeat-containing protein [Roseivivax sediminis]